MTPTPTKIEYNDMKVVLTFIDPATAIEFALQLNNSIKVCCNVDHTIVYIDLR